MISTVSIVLALAVTFNAANTVAPGNPGAPGNPTGNLNIFEKPRLDAFQKILPGEPKSRPENLHLINVLNFKTQNRLKVFPSIIGNTSLFQGRTYDPEVGLYYYRNRYYHPELGRFLQRDPNGYEDSMNLYQAFGMNPVNFVDPFGLYTKEQRDYVFRLKRDKGLKAAKAWIDASNLSNLDKLNLHFSIISKDYDPDAELMINYIPVWDEFWGFVDETAYQMSKPYLKYHAGVKYQRPELIYEGLGEIVVYGGTGGLLGHYIPEGVQVLSEKFPFLNKPVSSLLKKGSSSPGTSASVGIESTGIATKSEAVTKNILTKPKPGSLSNLEARLYYNAKIPVLKRIVDRMKARGSSIKAIAERISHLRNILKIRTRNFMKDQALAESLPPIRPFEYYVEKYLNQGLIGDELYNRIIEGALKPNPGVNLKLGIK